MNELINAHFILHLLNHPFSYIVSINIKSHDEIKRGITSEDQFVLSQLNHVALCITTQN